MGKIIRSFDWTKTELGSITTWPQSLYSSVNLILHSPVPMVILWAKNGIMIYNDGYSQFAGSRHPSLLGSKVVEGWSEVADFNRNVMKVCLSGKTLSYKDQELTLRRKNTTEQVWMDLNYSPIFGDGIKPVGVLAVVVETTQRIQAEEKQKLTEQSLAKEKEQFKMMADNIPNLAWMAEADGSIYWYNRRWYEFTGTTPKEMEGWGWQSVHNPDILPKVLDTWKSSIKSGEPFEMVFPLLSKTGKYRQFITRVQPVKNSQSAVTNWFGTNTDITEQLESQSRQQRLSDELVYIMESMGDAFFILDKNFTILRVNKMQEKLSGTKRIQTIGKNFWKVFPHIANTDNDYWKNYHKVIKTNKAVHFTDYYAPLDLWTEVDAYPTAQGGISVFFRDVSARKNGEEERRGLIQELEAEKDRFRTLIEKSTDAIQLVDPEGKILYSSESIKNVLGYSSKELQNTGVEPYLHPDDKNYFYKKFSEIIASPKKPITFQYRVKHKDGTWAWLETTGVNHLDTPTVKALVGTFRNITNRKIADEKLQQQLQLTKALTDMSTACLFMIDANGFITYMNPSAELVTGFSQQDAIGSSMHSLVHHSRPDGIPYPETQCPLVQTYRHGKPNPLHEDTFFKKDGTPFSALVTGTPIPGANGMQGTVVEFRDITEEKRAQNELRELITITEQRNALIKINQTKDEFIGMASHQLRTPATAVKQYIGLILDDFAGPLTTEQRSYIQIAYESNERELQVINDLLKTAQIASENYVLNKQRHDISALLQMCVNDLKPTLNMRKQTIALSLPKKPIDSKIDMTEIKLALINLIENASKYSYPGSTIEVSLALKNNHFCIAVKDTGVGISIENQQRIFDKFTRVNNELSDTVSGTGLGLYWVKEIVNMHDGTVTLDSKLSEGSTFEIRIPLL